MEIIKTSCEACGGPLEFPRDFDNVICAACGAAFRVRRYKEAINLVAVDQDDEGASLRAGFAEVESRLAGLGEMIEDLTAQVEVIRGKEQDAPLQMGCALFGIFGLVLLVIAFFMTVARGYFGEWPFYLSLLVVVMLGAKRLRRKRTSRAEVERLRQERQQREIALADLEDERARLEALRQKIVSRQGAAGENGG